MKDLRYIIVVFSMVFAYLPANGQKNNSEPTYKQEISLGDIDDDNITDTLYYHAPDSVIVFLLSSNGFQPLLQEYYMDSMDPEHTYFSAFNGGFMITTNHMRASDIYSYSYEPDSKRFRLSGYFHENFGNALNDGSGTMFLDLITGEFTGDWSYYDLESDSLISLPTAAVHVDNPAIYLDDDIVDFSFPGYELYENYKEAYEPPYTFTLTFHSFEYDYDYATLVGIDANGEKQFETVACNHEELFEGDLIELTRSTHCYEEPGDSSYRAANMITNIKVIRPSKLR